MSNPPFGFGLPDPDKGRDNDSSGGQSGSGADAFQQLGQMLSQLGQMLSQAGSSSGPVNYDLAKQIALQRLGSEGQMGFSAGDSGETAVRDSAHLAELWLDEATILPAGATTTTSWTARDWIEKTLPTWQRLCDPVAKQVSGAWMQALPEEAKQAAGPLLSMVSQMGGMAFGSQLGNALAGLASEVLTSTDVGLPLGPEATSALLPKNIDKFTEGLERPKSEVLVFIAAREAAHQRLFAHVPWLRSHLFGAVEGYARGIDVDTAKLEDAVSQLDPSNPEQLQEALQQGMFQPEDTPQQKAALARLETALALVEGWVDAVVHEAAKPRLASADALRETLRRRRASGGPAEQTFATLIGLELRPRRLRDASRLWASLADARGSDGRDALWEHPDMLPTAQDLDDPDGFVHREHADFSELDKLLGEAAGGPSLSKDQSGEQGDSRERGKGAAEGRDGDGEDRDGDGEGREGGEGPR